MGIIEGEGGGDGHLFWVMLGVGLNSSMDPDRYSSCWGLVLWEEVRLLVGLSGGGGGWSWVESGVGAWTGLAVGVGLNSKGEGLWLADSIDLIRVLIFDYVIHFRMAKAHECPLAAVCKGVCEEA